MRVIFLDRGAYEALASTIVQTGQQQHVYVCGSDGGMNQLTKDFFVYDVETFRIALQFKAACNWVCKCGLDAPPPAYVRPEP